VAPSAGEYGSLQCSGVGAVRRVRIVRFAGIVYFWQRIVFCCQLPCVWWETYQEEKGDVLPAVAIIKIMLVSLRVW